MQLRDSILVRLVNWQVAFGSQIHPNLEGSKPQVGKLTVCGKDLDRPQPLPR